MSIFITNHNIRDLVRRFITDKNSLPEDMRIINDWDVSNVTDMSKLFYCTDTNYIENYEEFNELLDKWDVSNVKDMSYMFSGCVSFNRPLNDWDVSNVSEGDCMEGMFENCESFNQPLDKWIVSGVTNMRNMFMGCKKFNKNLSKWLVLNVTNMEIMFAGCENLTKNPNWKIQKETIIQDMFIDTPIEGVELNFEKIDFNSKQVHKDVENTHTVLIKHPSIKKHKLLPPEIIDNVFRFHDPYGYTRRVRTINRNRNINKNKIKNSKGDLFLLPRNESDEPGGGGFYPSSGTSKGGKKRGRKTTQKRNKKV